MKKILFTLLLIPTLVFGQATGKVISDKPSGGSIGSAATTVDVVTLFNLNQTTAGQTLTVPDLTNAAAGKIIYVNNVGAASLTLSPGGILTVGRGVVLRWDGTQWNVCGIGGITGDLTANYIPLALGDGSVQNSIIQQDGTDLIVPNETVLRTSNSGSYLSIGDGTEATLKAGMGGKTSTVSLRQDDGSTLNWSESGGNTVSVQALPTQSSLNFEESGGATGRIIASSSDANIYHTAQVKLDAPIIKWPQFTADKIPYVNGSNNLEALVVGSGLSLSSGTLTATGSGGTVTSIATTSPITGGTITGTGTIGINNAAADGSTKGAASFTASDFDATTGNISIDYTNGQAASGSNKGFLTSADWTTFNGKQSEITFGTGVQTSLGVNIGSAGAPVLFNGALGTPASGVLTNCTGTASGLTAGNVTTNANLTGPITSVGNATTISNDVALPGNPTTTTQSAGNNSTRLATTAYVKTAMDAQLASYNILRFSMINFASATAAGTYFTFTNSNATAGTNGAASGVAVATVPAAIYIAAADYPSVNGLTPKLRIRANMFTNNTAAAGVNFTFGLYPITAPASAGGAGVRSHTIGTVVTGSNGATQATPAVSTNYSLVSSDFDLPADGWYVICATNSGTTATNSFVECVCDLQITYK